MEVDENFKVHRRVVNDRKVCIEMWSTIAGGALGGGQRSPGGCIGMWSTIARGALGGGQRSPGGALGGGQRSPGGALGCGQRSQGVYWDVVNDRRGRALGKRRMSL